MYIFFKQYIQHYKSLKKNVKKNKFFSFCSNFDKYIKNILDNKISFFNIIQQQFPVFSLVVMVTMLLKFSIVETINLRFVFR